MRIHRPLVIVALAAAACQPVDRVGGDAAPAGGVDLPEVALAEGITPEEMETRVERFAPVTIDFDDSLLDADRRVVVARLVEASAILGQIFRRQVWRDNPAYRARLEDATGPGLDAARTYYDIMVGPWDRLEENEPFLAVGPKPAGAGYYPGDVTAAEIETWLAEQPADSAAFTSYYTIVERADDGGLRAVPYSEAYAGRLETAAALLREAADHAANPSLAAFLSARATAFETNDYVESEVAWMSLEDNLVEPTIGPYEVYEDGLMGWKAAFESFVTIVDPEASAQLETLVRHLPDLEAALPMDERYVDLEKSFASPLSVVDEIYTAGDTRAGVQTLAFNLPNDPRVTKEHGTKKVMLRNVIEAKFETILAPIARTVMDPTSVEGVRPRAFFVGILMHELAHGLGPRTVHGTDTPSSVALGPAWSATEEAKADVVGVLSLAELTDRGVYDEEFLRQIHVSAVADLFRCVRFGTGEAHGKGCAVQFHALLDGGALEAGDDGRFAIDFAAIRPAYAGLARELLTIEATGDRAGAEALLEEKGFLPSEVEEALTRLEDVPVDIRPVYAVTSKMETW